MDKVSLYKTVGKCYVAEYTGVIDVCDAQSILREAAKCGGERRILIKGGATVSAGAARVFADAGTDLIGTCTQSTAPDEQIAEVHRILLGAGTLLLEGLRMQEICEGCYFICALPLNLEGCDGAPCRVILIDEIDWEGN